MTLSLKTDLEAGVEDLELVYKLFNTQTVASSKKLFLL